MAKIFQFELLFRKPCIGKKCVIVETIKFFLKGNNIKVLNEKT